MLLLSLFLRIAKRITWGRMVCDAAMVEDLTFSP